MKKTVILLALVIIATISCNEDYKFYAFYIDKEVEVEYPVSENDEEVTVTSDIVDLYIDKIYTQEETSADLVEEVTMTDIPDPSSYFKTFKLYLGAEGLSEILVAEKTDDAFVETEANVKEIVNASKIYIKIVGLANGTGSSSIIKYNLNFFIKTYVK